MTLEELKVELASALREVNSYGNHAYYIEKRFSASFGSAADLDKELIVRMVRKIRNDCLLWCDDIISFARENSDA